MKREVLRVQRVRTLESIGAKLGIDFTAIRRQPDEEHLQLAQLQMIDCALERQRPVEELLQEIENIPGIGEATMAKIRSAL